MLPLQWVAAGLLLVLLDVGVSGWDVLPDPLGWALVLGGMLALPRRAEVVGGAPLAAGALALVVSLAAYPPGLLRLDAALGWAVSLPQVVTTALLAFALARAEPQRRTSWRLAGWLQVAVALMPALVLGGGARLTTLVGLAAFVAVASLVYLVWLLLSAPAELPAATG